MERKDVSQLLNKTIGPLIIELKEKFFEFEFKNKTEGDYFLPEKPVFISQKAGTDDTKIVSVRGAIKDKMAAQRFGAKNQEEFSYWAWRACAIVALQMVLKTELGEEFKSTTMDLIREGLELKGYDIPTDFGWYHKSLVSLAKRHSLDAEMRRFVPSIEVANFIDKNKYVLCSIKSDFGGHILLAYGYQIDKNGKFSGLWINDPDNSDKDKHNNFIPKTKFDKIFKHRVILIDSKKDGK